MADVLFSYVISNSICKNKGMKKIPKYPNDILVSICSQLFQKSKMSSEEQEVRFVAGKEQINNLKEYYISYKNEHFLCMPKSSVCYLGPNFSKNFTYSNSSSLARRDFSVLKKTGIKLIQMRPSDTEFSIVPSNGKDNLFI